MKTFFKEPKKEEELRYYFNSTIRIKKDAKPLNRYKKVERNPIKTARLGRSTIKTTKKKYQKAYKPKYPYKSIFTDNLKKCYISGKTENIDIHHIFGGPRKAFSEKYGFIIPLTTDWHTQAPYAIHRDRKLDLKYKIKCEEYWINTLNKTKEEWILECGKWWEIDEMNEDKK